MLGPELHGMVGKVGLTVNAIGARKINGEGLGGVRGGFRYVSRCA